MNDFFIKGTNYFPRPLSFSEEKFLALKVYKEPETLKISLNIPSFLSTKIMGLFIVPLPLK